MAENYRQRLLEYSEFLDYSLKDYPAGDDEESQERQRLYVVEELSKLSRRIREYLDVIDR